MKYVKFFYLFDEMINFMVGYWDSVCNLDHQMCNLNMIGMKGEPMTGKFKNILKIKIFRMGFEPLATETWLRSKIDCILFWVFNKFEQSLISFLE